jgi:hypothetical protein
MLPFGDYRPDVAAYQSASSQVIQNVIPRGDGYGPFPGFTAFTNTLPGPCRGYFYARKADGSIAVFAATATDLYLLNNSTFGWLNVSKGAGPPASPDGGFSGADDPAANSYSAIPGADQWQFAQFNNFVVAVQINVPPQVYDLTASTSFADLAGSPPQARYVAVVGRFLVLSGLGSSTPYRIQWSGLNATTTWTAGVNQSDFQDFPDGGIVRGVAGGEYGVVFQDAAVRRMTYAPGSPVIFQIDRLSEEKGLFAPLSIVRAAGSRVFYIGSDGFQMIVPGGAPQAIGKERVDRSFFADVDTANLQLCIGVSDPRAPRVYWAYKSIGGASGLFDKMLGYDYALDRFFPVTISGEYVATLAKPGLTLESLDALAPGIITVSNAANNGAGKVRLTISSLTAGSGPGSTNLGLENSVTVYGIVGTSEANGTWPFLIVDATHIDLPTVNFVNAYVAGGKIGGSLDQLPFSLDDVSSAALSQLSAMNSAHTLGFFTGAALEATLDTPEQAIPAGAGAGGGAVRRTRVQGFRPVTDAANCFGSIGARENLQGAVSYSPEQPVNGKGFCPANVSTRLARARLRIPAGASWSFAGGVEPLFAGEGTR